MPNQLTIQNKSSHLKGPFVLIVGGAGYVGSTTCHQVKKMGYIPIALDNLSKGHAAFLPGIKLEIVDFTDLTALRSVFKKYDFDAVLHFAALSEVEASSRLQDEYYRVNVQGTEGLLEVMGEAKIKNLVFSSSAAVYGNPENIPISEDHHLAPVNPYGHTKLLAEQAIANAGNSFGLSWVALRYFNAAGANPLLPCGEWHDPETHLIPNALLAATGHRDNLNLFGTDHPTPDGTAVRDYVHVSDLAGAHTAALSFLNQGGKSRPLNLGTGKGYSVKEVIESARVVTGKPIKVIESEIRQGDPPILISNPAAAMDILNWTPQYTQINDMVGSAWTWYKKNGFRPKRTD